MNKSRIKFHCKNNQPNFQTSQLSKYQMMMDSFVLFGFWIFFFPAKTFFFKNVFKFFSIPIIGNNWDIDDVTHFNCKVRKKLVLYFKNQLTHFAEFTSNVKSQIRYFIFVGIGCSCYFFRFRFPIVLVCWISTQFFFSQQSETCETSKND